MKYRDYAKGFAVSGGKLEEWNSVLPNVHLKLKFKCKSQGKILSIYRKLLYIIYFNIMYNNILY